RELRALTLPALSESLSRKSRGLADQIQNAGPLLAEYGQTGDGVVDELVILFEQDLFLFYIHLVVRVVVLTELIVEGGHQSGGRSVGGVSNAIDTSLDAVQVAERLVHDANGLGRVRAASTVRLTGGELIERSADAAEAFHVQAG